MSADAIKMEHLTIGGLFGIAATTLATLVLGFLLHLRETKKVNAAAGKVEAERDTITWNRFQAEIDRLVKRVERLEDELRKAHREKAAVEHEYAEYRHGIEQMGNNRQVAQLVASTIKAEKKGQDDG